MKIVAGQFRGRNLVVPDTKDTRPTMDRTRQAVFNILRSASWALKDNGEPILQDAHVLDVFAGSGAMGFEALSQGAAHCTFIDNATLAITAMQKNQGNMKLEAASKIIKRDAAFLPMNSGPVCQLAFLDPPYKSDLLVGALSNLLQKNYIDQSTLLVMEMQKREDAPESVEILDTRTYGVSKIIFGQLKIN